MCECESTTVIDYATGDTICINCGHVSQEQASFGDFCDPWSIEADLSTTPDLPLLHVAINMSNVYVSVCSTIASFFTLSKKTLTRFFKKCAEKNADHIMHKPINVALAVLYEIDPSLFEDIDLSVFNTTKQSVCKLVNN